MRDRMRNQAEEALLRTQAHPKTRELLGDVADRLTERDPDQPMTQAALLARVNAAAYRLHRGEQQGTVNSAIHMALKAAPEIRPAITRGEYALVLRRAAGVTV